MVKQDRLLDGVGAQFGAFLRRITAEFAAVRVGIGHVHGVGWHGLVLVPRQERVRAEPHGAPGAAVVRALAADHLEPALAAGPVVVGLRHLDGRLVRLRAAACEKRSGEVAG